MKTLKGIIDEIFQTEGEGLKASIAKACRQMAVESGRFTRKEVEDELQKYLYPQIMRSTVIEYSANGTENMFVVETDMATISVDEMKPTISWDGRMVLLAKKHLKNKSNGINKFEHSAGNEPETTARMV